MKEYERPMHIITALLVDNSLSLGQKVVESKSNEIPAVRELLDEINIKGAIVTMDAMHCQKETAEKVIENGGDYVLQLKAICSIFVIWLNFPVILLTNIDKKRNNIQLF